MKNKIVAFNGVVLAVSLFFMTPIAAAFDIETRTHSHIHGTGNRRHEEQ